MAYIGIRLSDKSKSEIQSIAKDLDKTVSDITRELIETFIEAEINCLVSPFTTTLDLIHTVPGFDKNPLTAITVVSEIGVDMSVFPLVQESRLMGGLLPQK